MMKDHGGRDGMQKKRSFRLARAFAICLSLGTTLILYQNCGTGFRAIGGSGALNSGNSLDESSPQLPSEPNEPPSGSTPPPSTGNGGNYVVKTCSAPDARGSSRPSLRRMSKSELTATLTDLVGATLVSKISAELALYPPEAPMYNVDNFSQLHSAGAVEALGEIAYRLGELISTSATERSRLGGSCLGQTSVALTCYTQFVTSFGKKVLRRPLANEEISSFTSMSEGRSVSEATHVILARLFSAPELSFHIESGKSQNGTRLLLTDYEIASRISYAITGTMPDSTLFAAADSGSFTSDPSNRLTNVESHVRRLMATAKAKENLRALFDEWLQTSGQTQPPSAVTTWAGLNKDGLGAELNGELMDYVSEVVWKNKGSFYDLMTSAIAVPRTERVAKIYDASSFTGAAVAAPNHPGLLFRAAILASPKVATSPILRGVFLKRQIFCETVGAPPAEANQPPAVVPDPTVFANFEIVTQRTSAPLCMGCHMSINPVGFALERFDPLGRVRSVESVLSENGQVLKTHALPNPSSIVLAGTSQSFSSPTEIAQFAGRNPRAIDCMSAYVFRHMSRRRESTNDTCAVQDVANSLGVNESVFDAIVKSVANEDIFWRGL